VTPGLVELGSAWSARRLAGSRGIPIGAGSWDREWSEAPNAPAPKNFAFSAAFLITGRPTASALTALNRRGVAPLRRRAYAPLRRSAFAASQARDLLMLKIELRDNWVVLKVDAKTIWEGPISDWSRALAFAQVSHTPRVA
jgi:hypothetical protein